MPASLPIDKFYEGRRSFTIIGLTGATGSGCSTLAEIMSSSNFLQNVRRPEDIHLVENRILNNEEAYGKNSLDVNNKAVGNYVFKRKYTVCYNFANSQYQPYTVIKYTHIIWLFAILEIYRTVGENLDAGTLKSWFAQILKDKFKPSQRHDADFKDSTHYDEAERDQRIDEILSVLNFEELAQSVHELPFNDIRDNEKLKKIRYELKEFFKSGSAFDALISALFKRLGEVCAYSLAFLHHKMASQIRKKGSLRENYHDVFNSQEDDYAHLNDLVWLMNIVIKGYQRESQPDGTFRKVPVRIVIDSLRNSQETLFLKERYNAFYLVAVHDERTRLANLKAKVKAQMPEADDDVVEAVSERMDDLSRIEGMLHDYKIGKFSSPNIEQTVADAEIHIINNRLDDIAEHGQYEFVTMGEQWMKYSSLLLHPGLITPSPEERCMVVAYTAKFNSACLSRQVGAVITNQYHSIRTIGWNDVPYGHVPCGLRELNIIAGADDCDKCVFSEFERSRHEHYRDGCTFKEQVSSDYPDIENQVSELNGLAFSYCFKTLHNRYEGEANQVFTRSLHAEENAILQMAKYGGEPLMNGVIYVTASPCELCAKKLYQIGVRKIVYIDPYPGISRQHIIRAGFRQPALKLFQGVYGTTYFKLYQPFMSYKDEIDIRIGHDHKLKTKDELLKEILKKKEIRMKDTYTKEEIDDIVNKVFE